jgi:predicted transcriptional regulator
MVVVEPKELKSIRKNIGITQTELAKLANTHQVHVSKIESGKVSPSLDMMVRLTKALGIGTHEKYSFTEAATGLKKEVEVEDSIEIVGETGQLYRLLKLKDGIILIATGKFDRRSNGLEGI